MKAIAKKTSSAARGKRKINLSRLGAKGYALKDGRPVVMVPWVAITPQPWTNGYARVFIPYTESELRHARGSKRGHEQIVRISGLKRT